MAFNQLTDAETERLACLAEEAAEVIHAVGKILRHGYEDGHPERPSSNRHDLTKEVGDFLAIVDIMVLVEDLRADSIETFKIHKRTRVQKYLHHQHEWKGTTTGRFPSGE